MSSVKPLTVVTKVGRLRPEGLKGSDDIFTPTWDHEDCVTLADAERYAAEKVAEALYIRGLPDPDLGHLGSRRFHEAVSAEVQTSIGALREDYGKTYLLVESLLGRVQKLEKAMGL